MYLSDAASSAIGVINFMYGHGICSRLVRQTDYYWKLEYMYIVLLCLLIGLRYV